MIGFKNNHIATCNLSAICNGDIARVYVKENEIERDRERDKENNRDNEKLKRVPFNYVYMGFHNGSIDFIEVCAQRPLVATCSNEDGFVRIWNYMDFKSEFAFRTKPDAPDSELTKPLQCMAFHPGGYYLALGTTSALRLIYIMEEKTYEYRDINIKNVNIIKFSRGGQYLAVSNPIKKGTNPIYQVTIYDSYTLEFVDSFHAHTNILTDMVWGYGDNGLYTCGLDGSIKIWTKPRDQKELEEFPSEKNTQYTSITVDKAGVMYLVAEEVGGSGRCMLQMRTKNGPVVSFPFKEKKKATRIRLFETPTGAEALMVGTEEGKIMVFPKSIREGDYQHLCTHIESVTYICADINGRYLFTAGADGLLNIYQTVSRTDRNIDREGDDPTEVGKENNMYKIKCVKRELADVVLVNRKDIQDYRDRIEKHKQALEEIKTKIEHKATEQKNNMENEKKQIEDKLNLEVQRLTKRVNDIMNQKLAMEAKYAVETKTGDENHLKAVEDLEALYEKKLIYENDKYIKLENELTEERMSNDTKLNEIKNENKKIIEQLREEFRTSYEEAKKIYDQTKETSKNLDAEYKKRLAQQEEEHELEIRELNKKHKEELDKYITINSSLNKDKEGISQELKKMRETKNDNNKIIQEKVEEIAKLNAKVFEQENKINKLKKELEDTSETLRKKEKNIYDAKTKINDLQKAKHVLSFRTTEMRKSLEPKEAQIEKLKEELFKLETEFESMFKTTHEQEELLKRKDDQLTKLKKKYQAQVVLTKKRDNELNKIKMELFNVSKAKDNKTLAQEFIKVYQKNVAVEKLRSEKPDEDSIGEMKRQIDYLENCLHQINVSTDKLVKNREMQIMKRTKDNIQLIRDLNLMKMTNKGKLHFYLRPYN